MCTALTYLDARGRAYVARTFELDLEIPMALTAAPVGTVLRSQMPGKEALEWTSAYAFIAVVTPPSDPGGAGDFSELLSTDGTNDAGLTININAYPPDGYASATPDGPVVLEAANLGIWLLSRFATVAEAKDALATQQVNQTALTIAGGVPFPLHVLVTDAGGASIVIEWDGGVMCIHDNPVRVMTNGPAFLWHLTNLANWTHLDNTDKSVTTFGSLQVSQPDSGIATAALPASNTAVGRFVRAAYYTTFAEKTDDPDQAVAMAAHIINNFDRPKGITIDLPGAGGEGVVFGDSSAPTSVSTEWTTHSFLTDTARNRYYVRAHTSLNWSEFHLDRLSQLDAPRIIPMDLLDPQGGDATELLLNATTD